MEDEGREEKEKTTSWKFEKEKGDEKKIDDENRKIKRCEKLEGKERRGKDGGRGKRGKGKLVSWKFEKGKGNKDRKKDGKKKEEGKRNIKLCGKLKKMKKKKKKDRKRKK